MITLNKINFININTPHKMHKIPAFKGEDVFIRNFKGNKMHADKDILTSFNQKTKGLPIGMDGVMVITGKYLSGGMSCDEFSKIFLDRTPVLFKRIELGTDKAEYSDSYKPEITLIKAVNPLCDEYLNHKISGKDFDAVLGKLVETYVNTEHKRGKLFVK